MISWLRAGTSGCCTYERIPEPTRAYLHNTRGCPFWLHGSLIRWRGVWLFHHLLRKSLRHVAFLPWRDGASYSQATTTTPLSLSVLTFPSRIEDIRSFDVNMELPLIQRPFQEVTSGSSVPSSGPNGGGRAPEFIDYPHPLLKSHIWYKTEDSRTRR